MTRTVAFSSFFAGLLLLVQTTWLRNGIFGGIVPDLAVLLIVWVAYSNRGSEGVLTAFVAGLLCDLLSAAPLGYFAFVYVVTAYLLSSLKRSVSMDRLVVPALMGAASIIVKALASALLSLFFGDGVSAPYAFTGSRLWIETAVSAVAAPLVFLILSKFPRVFVTRRAAE